MCLVVGLLKCQTDHTFATHPILPGKLLINFKEKVNLSEEVLDQETIVSCPSESFVSSQLPIRKIITNSLL